MSDDREPWSTRRIGCVTFGALGLAMLLMIVTSSPGPDQVPESTTSAFADDLRRIQDSDGTELQATETALSFDACIRTIQNTADEVGIAPVNIVETGSMRVVRFPLDRGSILITCGDGKMVVTRSPHDG